MANNKPVTRLVAFVKERRMALGLSQVKFAGLVGMSQASYARFEILTESNNIDPRKIAVIERVLGLTENYLYLVMGGFASAADLFVSDEVHPIMRLIAEAGIESVTILQIQHLIKSQKALASADAKLTPSMIPDLIKQV